MMNAILEMELDNLWEIEEADEEELEEVKERFKITDLESANWAFRKLKAIEEKKKEIEELANKEIEPYKLEISRINEWKDTELKSFDRSIAFFNFLLEEYYREQRKLDPKFKVTTPYGKITSRKQQPKWNYEDEKLIGYLEHYKPELIRIKKEVNKNDFKKAVKEKDGFILMDDGKVVSNETGELIEGVTVEERPDSINIKVVE